MKRIVGVDYENVICVGITVDGILDDNTNPNELVNFERVRHGHWVDAEVIGVDQPTVRCPICGIRFCDLINNHRFMYKYCPHCGTKMDEEDNT